MSKSDPTEVGDVPSRREHLGLLGLWAAVTGWILLSAPGRIVAETKLALTWDPGRFLARATSAWDPSASFGGLQNQAVGYLLPTGVVTGISRAVGMPVWLTQRIWLSLLLGTAMLGMHRLVTGLGVRGLLGRLSAAVVYALAPSFLMIASYHGGTALPHALAPWVLVPLVDHRRLGPRRAALRSAVAVALMGGINAASTIAVLPVVGLWFLTREPGRTRRLLAAWWVGGVVAATAWWMLPFLVSIRHGFDFIPFTERIDLTARTQSATDAWRGTGHWLTYIDQGGRVLQPGARGLVVDARAIAGSMAIVIAGAWGLLRRDAPGRRWLVPTAAVGAVALAAVYTGPGNAGPIASAFRSLLDGPLVAFRNVHKFSPLVQLPLAVGVGHTVSVLTSRGRPRLRPVAPVAVTVVVLASIAPMIPGRILLPGSFLDLPDAWYEVAGWVDGGDPRTRTLLLPGSIGPDHRWGDPQDEPLGLLVDSTWAVRDIIPLGGNGSTRLLDGVDESLRRGTVPIGFTEALRRAGIGRIIVRNDLRSDHDGAPSAATIRRALRSAPGLTPGPSFGPIVEPDPTVAVELVGPGGAPPDTDPIRSLDTYVVGDAVGRFEVLDPTAALAVGGGPEALILLPPDLIRHRPVLLADDRDGFAAALSVATDTARRRDVIFGRIRNNSSETLEENQPGPFSGGEPLDRWADPDPPPRTVAVLEGASSITEDLPVGFRPPGWQPFAAFDRDPNTFWVPGGAGVGRHLEIRFGEHRVIPSVALEVPDVSGRHIAAVEIETVGGVTPARIGPDGSARVELPAGPTDRLVIRITDVEPGEANLPLGISEIDLEGVSIRRPLRTASPSPDGWEPSDVVVLDRDRSGIGSVRGVDEDGVLDRITALTDGPRDLAGEAGAVGGPILDALIDEFATAGGDEGPLDPTAPSTVTGGSWFRLPGHGPTSAFDGHADSFWAIGPAAGPNDGARLGWDEPRTIRSLTFRSTDRPGSARFGDVEVGVTIDGRRTALRPDADGRVEFPEPVVTDRLGIDLSASGASAGLPITVGAIDLDDASVTLAPVDPDLPIELPCGRGPLLEVDGRAVPTALRTTVGAIRRGDPARWWACDRVTVTGDETRITASHHEPFRIDTLIATPTALRSSGDGDGSASHASIDPADRPVRSVSWGSQSRRVEVDAGDPIVLATTENSNSGWGAGLEGDHAPSMRIDGWRQAHLVPGSTQPRVLRIDYGPNRLFRAGLAVGGFLLAVLFIGAFAPRRRGEAPAELAERGPSRAVATISAGIVGLLLGGPVAATVIPLAWLRRRDRDVPGRVLLIALGVVALLLLAPVGVRWASTNAAFFAPTQIAAVVAWIAFTLGAAD